MIVSNKLVNVPLCDPQIVPLHKDSQCKKTRKYVTHEQISLLAIERGKMGITYNNLMTNFGCTKNQAQRKLKYMHSGGVIFTAGEIISKGLEPTAGFKNSRPQRYYATAIKSDIIEKLKEDTKNVLLRTTVPSHSRHPLSNCLDYEKATNFLEAMLRLPWRPLHIHKIQIELPIDKECYNVITGIQWKGNAGRCVKEIIDHTHVKYVYYKKGKVSVYIECSGNPFRLENEANLAILYSFLGQVRDRLESHVNDPRGRLTANITTWILKQCDFNKDVSISDKAQITLPDIQLSSAFETFRLYVKNLGGDALYRCEDSRKVNQPLVPYLNSTINAAAAMFSRIEKIEGKIDAFLENKTDSIH
jgi:hypothetical protein